MNVCDRNFPLKEKKGSQISVWPLGISGCVSLTVFHSVFCESLPLRKIKRALWG